MQSLKARYAGYRVCLQGSGLSDLSGPALPLKPRVPGPDSEILGTGALRAGSPQSPDSLLPG